jgi:hypothetical protein
MSLIRFTFICLLLVFAVTTGRAQGGGKCTVTLAQLPTAAELYGFKPGMTLAQVRARFPRLEVGRADQFGVMKTSVNPTFDPTLDKTGLAGVRTFGFDFLDGQLYTLSIGYDAEFKWQTLEDFLPGIDKALNLPDAWLKKDWRGQELDCADFQLTARLIAQSPSLIIVDKTARATLNKRIADAADKEP